MVRRGATSGLPIVLDGDSRRMHLRRWRTAVLPEARSRALRKLAAASSCLEQAHVSLYTFVRMATCVSSARGDPYGLTADDFIGPPMQHRTGHGTRHEALACGTRTHLRRTRNGGQRRWRFLVISRIWRLRLRTWTTSLS